MFEKNPYVAMTLIMAKTEKASSFIFQLWNNKKFTKI